VICASELVSDLVSAALAGCAPGPGTRSALARRRLAEPVFVVGFGKCAAPMMRGLLEVCRPRRAVIIAPPGAHGDLEAAGVRVLMGGHPHPVSRAPEQARELLEVASEAPPQGTLVVLVSGGGSSLFELPAPGLSIEEIREVADALMARGAAIDALNVVRQALSDVKGGRLAARTRAHVVTLVSEDVPGRPELVASGPTCSASAGDAAEILGRFGIALDESLRRALARPPLPLAAPPDLEVVADNASARRALVAAGARRGLDFLDLGCVLEGEARVAGAQVVASARAVGRPVVCGGETTVTVRGPGRGGRNQELVLGAFLGDEAPPGLVCSFGTDGVDGRSEHAGAFLDPQAWRSPARRALDPRASLERNDTAPFFADLGTAIRTGPTGANVADVCFVIP
jgi:glycerate-2-kinase